jgi:hypothetical protein
MTHTEPCRLGYEEHDGSRYCHEHGGFVHYAMYRTMRCDRSTPAPLPLHRTEAGYPRCATCDGGGCLDCTDPA